MKCPTCGASMDVFHSPGVSCFAAAMAGRSTPHDVWTCSNQYETWHSQASAIKREIDSTASKTIRDLLTTELNQILSSRQSTLDEDFEDSE